MPNIYVDIPDDYLPDFPAADRRSFWADEVGRNVTKMAKKCKGQTGIEDFDHAWRLLTEDRPNKPAEKCPLRRKLVRRFYHELTKVLL